VPTYVASLNFNNKERKTDIGVLELWRTLPSLFGYKKRSVLSDINKRRKLNELLKSATPKPRPSKKPHPLTGAESNVETK